MKNAKIIQINGLGGILKVIFIALCLAAGFVVFPGFVAKTLWNKFLIGYLPAINLFQGILLWIMTVVTYWIATKRGFSIRFATPEELNEEEMEFLMNRIRLQADAKRIHDMMFKSLNDSNLNEESPQENMSEKQNEE